MMIADLHIHSVISDGSDSIEELIKRVKQSNLNIFALTDHDTVAGIEQMQKLVPGNIQFIKGIELTCTYNNLRSHILGYNIDINNNALLKLIEKGKVLRRKKLDTRIEFLKSKWKIELTKEELDWLYTRQSPVKTHFGVILVNRGLSDSLVEAMDKYFDGCKTGNTRFDTKEAIDTIISAGGIPVWAHPLGGEGETHINKNTFLERLNVMQSIGIKGIECFYSRYDFNEINMLKEIARDKNLLITGGSDYHGANKNISIGQLNTINREIDKSELTLLNKIL